MIVTDKLSLRTRQAADAVLARYPHPPTLAFVLGSGLGAFADELKKSVRIPYSALPHFEKTHIEGHRGELVLGELDGRHCVVMSGRVHLYEGHSPAAVCFGVQVMSMLGARKLVVTNAAGSLNPEFRPGDIMMIGDQINMTGKSPTTGPNDAELGPRFFDMSYAFSRAGQAAVTEAAVSHQLSLQKGVYVGVLGPAYETPAEVRMLQCLGGDAVGMSTVLEVLAARHLSMEVVGLSVISNFGAGLSEQALAHAEVTEMAARVRPALCALLRETSKRWI